jgi:hypothetical protein
MSQVCMGLRDAENIAIANPSNRVCSNALAEVTYEAVGGRTETCWISQIEGVEDRSAAMELVQTRSASQRPR